MDDVVEQLRTVAPAILADEPVAFAYLFGSHATGTATPASDIDVAIKLSGDATDDLDRLALRFRVAAALERAIGMGPIEVALLDDLPLPLAGRVTIDGVLIASADESAMVRWTVATRSLYLDFQPLEARIAREKLAAMAADRG